MEKNLEKSLKRYLKRKVKITLGLVVSFLITGMVSFAEGETAKGIEKKSEVNEKLLLEELFREINLGNINIIENGEEYRGTQKIENGHIGINEGTVSGYYEAQKISGGIGINNNILTTRGEYQHTYGQNISNGLGINNGTINITSSFDNNYGQKSENNSLGINNGEMKGEYTQFILYNSLGINNGIISGTYAGQSIIYNAIGINNGTIKAKYSVQSLADRSLGINNGIVSSIVTDGYDAGQRIGNGGVAINNGVISATNGQSTDNGGGTGINNGIIIANNAYVSERGGETFHKNGIALKRENGKLVLNGAIGQAGNNENLTEKTGDFENNFTDQTTQKEKNIFINNLEGKKNNLNLISDSYDEVHITTAVSKESSFTENETVITTENNFSSLNKSTIIGYFEKDGTLADMTGTGNITLNDSVISAIAGNSDTGFSGTILTNVSAIKFGAENNIVTLNNSTVNGEMDFSDGNNTLNLNGKFNGISSGTYTDGTQYGTYVSDVEFGTGNDNIDIKFGEVGQETYNSSYDKKGLITLGNVNFGAGDDTLSVDFDEMKKGNFILSGNLDFGINSDGTAENDKIAFKSKFTAKDENAGAENIVLLNNLLFNKVSNLETLQLADGGNTFYFEGNGIGLGFNGKIVGGNGDETFKVSADKLKNDLDSLNGGIDGNKNPYNDNDILELTSVVDNTSDFILFKNVENVETLKLADVDGNKLDINNISTSNPDTLRFKNYIGGTGDDSFTVSIENFDKLSLIDGGANGTAGDTLKIDGDGFTNIKNDGTIDDTVFGKIQNIENLEFGESTLARLNLNNLSDDYLKNLNIKLGNYGDIITVSTEKLGKLKGLNGGNRSDSLQITNQITNENENFSFLAKGDGTNGINSIEHIRFSDEGNTINVDNLAKANNEITNINGGSGDDTFITSIETLQHIKNSNLGGMINGVDGKDTIKINDSLDNTTNSDILDEVYDIERLVLNKTGNNILVDNLYSSSNFEEIEGIDGGTNGNTFTINGTKTEALGVKIKGGSSVKDKLIVNTDISKEQLLNKTGIENIELGLNVTDPIDYTIDFTYKDQTDSTKNLEGFKNIISGKGNDHFKVSADNIGSMTIDGGGTVVSGGGGLVSRDHDILKLSGVIDNDAKGKENILNGISNVEDLELDNGENILNIDNIKRVDPNNTLGFKNIYGGNGNDTFKVSVENLAKLGILKGEISQGINDNDRLEITSGDIKDNSLEKVKNIESLTLAKNSSNVIGLDNLSFNSITKEGTGKDTFTINSNTDKLKMEINGGDGQYDTLKVNTSINMTNKGELQNIKGIENLLVNSKNGVNNLRFNKFNINSFEHIGLDGAENNLSLINLDKNISVLFRNENTDKNNLSVNDDNNIFNHRVIGANNINLYAKDKNTEWTFGKDATIMNNNKNTNINTDGIFNLGNLIEGKDGFTVNEDFVSSGSDITLNGDVKLTISKDTTFALEKLYNFSFSKLSLGADSEITLPEFLKTQNINQKDFTFRVKNWKEYTSVAQNIDFMTYEGRYKEAISKYNKDTAITNAFNSFTEDTIFNYVTNNMGDKLVYYSGEDTKPYAVKVTREDIVIKTNPDKSKDQSLNLAFNNISSSGNISIKATGGYYNTVTFGNGEGTSVIISSGDKENLSVINGTSSTEDLTLNFNGATNKVDKIVINNGNKNSINIKGDTEIGEITLGSGNDSIYAGENSQKLAIGNINLGAGDDMINIGSTGEIKLSNINLGSGKNEIYFRDISKVKEFNITKSDADVQNNVIITETGNNNESFNTILAGSKENIDNITVYGENTLNISKDFDGELTFAKSRDNVIGIETDYTGSISFTRGENTVNLSSGTVDGNKLSLAGSGNKLNITGGTLLNGITFDTNSYGNKVTVSENGSIGKGIIFGTGVKDEFNLTSKTGEFDYNIENADTINLNGKNNQWKFGQNSKIVGDNVTINLNDSGEIGFNIGKSDTGLVLGKGGVNPFAEAGKYIINGDIKVTFDDTFTFSSLNDKLSVNTNIFAGSTSKVYIPEFMKYDNKTFSIKSAEELKAFGLKDYAFGNYEHAILGYNKTGYEGITSMLNNNSLEEISKVLNKGIDEKDHYFYSDSREIKDVATLGNINIQTSKDNQVTGDKLNTDIKFTNVTGNVANINFAQGTTNSVSFLDGVNLSKIDGSKSEAGFTLNLNGVNFSKSQDEKDNTKVVMSDLADILNIQSELNNIGIDTGNGNDEINISSSVKNLTLNTGEGNDTVNILSSIKGIFDGNSGDNTLNIGAKTQTLSNEKPKDEIVLSGEIKNFQDINLNQNTKLDSKLAITGTNNINIAKDKVLSLGIDFDKKDSNGKVIGHSLYNKGITVNNNDGNIMVDVAETSKDTLISLGEKDSASKLTNDKNLLISGSTNHDISYDKDSGDVKVNVKEHFIGKEEEVKYGHLDKIYQSIYLADKVGLMAPSSTLKDKTKDEAIKAQLEFYGKIYHSTPYAYTHKISKKSAELITDSLMLNDGMPEVNSWRFGGSIAGRELENSENFYGNNYYNGIDVGNTEVKAETNIYGAYAFGEYGFEEGKAVGFAVAGSKSDTDIQGSSLKGNNAFVSAYVKQDINNVNMIAGIGYQRGFYDATRSVSNAYQSMQVEKDFEDNTFVGYFGAKYRYDFGNNFYLEPNGELRLTHSIQDDIKEDNRGDLSIEVDNKDFTSVDGELGVNLGKRIATENGVLNLKAGVSVNYALLGNDEEYLNARITGSTKDFEIISPEDEDRAKVNVLLKAEYQANNGMYYDVHYKTTTDNDDYSVGFGVGYKF